MNTDRVTVPRCIVEPHGTQLLKVVAAHDCVLVGASGREYLDLTSGWNVANLGWTNPLVLERVLAQLRSLAVAPAWCIHDPAVRLSEALSESLDREVAVLRSSTGTQAIEFALRIARRATARYAVVAVAECYHGSTMGSLAASGIDYLKKEDAPLVPWHRVIPLRAQDDVSLEALRAQILADPPPAAVLIEPLFTNPGVIDGGRKYYETLFAAARDCGALVIMDEVGTGLGRIGELFGCQRFGLTPDILVLGKSLGGAVMPMAAVIVDQRLRDAARGLAFDSTFAGTPAACAAALATLDILRNTEVLERSRECADVFAKKLRDVLARQPAVREIRHIGALFGIEFEAATPLEQARFARSVESRLLDQSIFAACSRHSNALLVMAPLTISEHALLSCAEPLAACIEQTQQSLAA